MRCDDISGRPADRRLACGASRFHAAALPAPVRLGAAASSVDFCGKTESALGACFVSKIQKTGVGLASQAREPFLPPAPASCPTPAFHACIATRAFRSGDIRIGTYHEHRRAARCVMCGPRKNASNGWRRKRRRRETRLKKSLEPRVQSQAPSYRESASPRGQMRGGGRGDEFARDERFRPGPGFL